MLELLRREQKMKNNIMVIAAHPDDEVLGCGATIAKHTKAGDKVKVIILAEGLTSRSKHRNPKENACELSQLVKSARKANDILGVSSIEFCDFPDNRMDSVDLLDIIKVVEGYIQQFKPEIIYTHHTGDLNIDHRIVQQAVVTACRPTSFCTVKTILFFEVPSSTEWQVATSFPYFKPNWFVNVSDTLSLKLKAMEEYHSEAREWPHPRSVLALQHLARWRGASIGVDAAEAFLLGRRLLG